MILFFDSLNPQDYDIKRLRRDLADEFGAQGTAFTGGIGFMEMMEVESASPEKLLKIARQEGINLEKYKK